MSKRIRKLVISLGVAAFALGTLVGALAPSSAAAPYFERVSAVVCQTQTLSGSVWFPVSDSTPTRYENSSSATTLFTCPIVHKSNLTVQSMSNIKVFVNDQNDDGTSASSAWQVRVIACSTTHTGGAACGPQKFSSGTGQQAITLTGADLGQIAVYSQPYLYVTLPKVDVAASSIVGLEFSKP